MAVVSPFNHNLNVQYISLSPRGTVLKGFSCFPQEQLMTDVFPHVCIRLSLGSKYSPLIDSFCLFFLRSVASSGCNVTLERPLRAHSEHAI